MKEGTNGIGHYHVKPMQHMKSIYQEQVQSPMVLNGTTTVHGGNTQITEALTNTEPTINQITPRVTRNNGNPVRKVRDKDSKSHSSGSVDSAASGEGKKKDKTLVFLSRSVLQSVRESPHTTGTDIANHILELYKKFSDKVDFKNVQRRVYDALNVLSAMDIISKEKNHILYNPDNEFIDDTIEPSTKPRKNGPSQ